MSRILIINTPGLMNRGGMAVVIGALRCLRECQPEAQITVLCHHCREDWTALEQICHRYDARVMRHPWFKEHHSRPLALLHSALPAIVFVLDCILGRAVARIGLRRGLFQESDLVLDLNVDALHDHYGIFFPTWALTNILFAKAAGKPVVVWSAGIGTFRRRLTALSARFILNRVDAIMAREEITRDYLKNLGVTKPKVYVTADHAFFMERVSQARTHEILAAEGIERGGRPLVGISASQQITKYAFPRVQNREDKYQRYVDAMTMAIDYLVSELDANVVLIPHVLNPRADDRIVSKCLHERVQNKQRVRMLTRPYMADELKGIIATCDMFIGARMHSTIASTSTGVPTVAIVYGQKFHGIIGGMMGQGDYIIEIANCSPDELSRQLHAKIRSAWANRDTIRRDLVVRAQAARRRAAMNGTLIGEFLQAAVDPPK